MSYETYPFRCPDKESLLGYICSYKLLPLVETKVGCRGCEINHPLETKHLEGCLMDTRFKFVTHYKESITDLCIEDVIYVYYRVLVKFGVSYQHPRYQLEASDIMKALNVTLPYRIKTLQWPRQECGILPKNAQFLLDAVTEELSVRK